MQKGTYEITYTIVVATVIFLLLAGFIVMFIVFYYRRQALNDKEKSIIKSTVQQEILHAQLEIQEQTLKTISQEIHDNIGQVLSLAKLNLNTMEITRLDELQEKIIDSKKLVSKAIQDLRDLSKGMNTDHIEALGLVRAIEYELEMIRKNGFQTELNVEGIMVRLEPQKELILFRIAQEVLNNIMKHAGANAIVVKLGYDTRQIKIEITDNGKGFDLTPLNENDKSNFGLGIRNMHNRAKLIGADFNMNSTIGEGTKVAITIPSNNHNL